VRYGNDAIGVWMGEHGSSLRLSPAVARQLLAQLIPYPADNVWVTSLLQIWIARPARAWLGQFLAQQGPQVRIRRFGHRADDDR
jgi:hypothetical protein